MAITNHERIGKCLEQLTAGLQPFVERELKSNYQDEWFAETRKTLSATQVDFLGTADKPESDIASLLATLWNQCAALRLRSTFPLSDRRPKPMFSHRFFGA